MVIGNQSGTRRKIPIGIFRIDSALNRMHLGIIIFAADVLARSQFDLLLDQIVIDNFLGDGMLDLDSGVHFHEIEIPVCIHEELHGSNTFILHCFCRFDGCLAHLITQFVGHVRRRCFLYQFLMAALDRAVALGQVTRFSSLIGSDLDFNVPWFNHELLHVHIVIAKRRSSFSASRFPSFRETFFIVTDLHAFSTATCSGFQHDGIADFLCNFRCLFQAFQDAFIPWNGWDSCFFHGRLGGRLVSHGLNHFRACSDEFDVIFSANTGKVSILRKETITRMDCIRVGDLCRSDDLRDIQIGLSASWRADAHGLISKTYVQAVGISCGIHGDCFDAHLLACADDSQGNLPAVRNQNFLEHGDWIQAGSTKKRG